MEAQLIEDYIAKGQARFEYAHFIVRDGAQTGNESRRAAEASECAAEQGRFWDYHDIVFANQTGEGVGTFPDRRLKAFAESLKLDTNQFNACFDSGRYAKNVDDDISRAVGLGVDSTPTLFVNNQPVADPFNYAALQQMIEVELAR